MHPIIYFIGSGKSTLATALERELLSHHKATYVLDGDNVRHGLNKDLGFGPADRKENIRRIGEVCNLFTDAGIIVLAAFVSPYKEDRDNVRSLLKNADGQRKNFIEVYVQASVSTCEERDPKGLYKLARAGEIQHFTGISAPFEEPQNPEVVMSTADTSVEDCVAQLMKYLTAGGWLSAQKEEREENDFALSH